MCEVEGVGWGEVGVGGRVMGGEVWKALELECILKII